MLYAREQDREDVATRREEWATQQPLLKPSKLVDVRQARKVRHKLKDILVIISLADADDWVEIAMFAEAHQDYLRKYIELKNGVPSHDAINRVMGLVSPKIMQ